MQTHYPCAISSFHREGDKNCARLGYHAVSSVKFLIVHVWIK